MVGIHPTVFERALKPLRTMFQKEAVLVVCYENPEVQIASLTPANDLTDAIGQPVDVRQVEGFLAKPTREDRIHLGESGNRHPPSDLDLLLDHVEERVGHKSGHEIPAVVDRHNDLRD